MMQNVLVVFFLLTSVAMVALILLQHGKGADAGAAFGSGASATVFGAQGSANFLSRTTAILAAAWFLIAMALGWYALQGSEEPGLMDAEQAEAPAPVKVVPPTDLPDIPEAKVEQAVSDMPDIPAAEVPVPDAEGGAADQSVEASAAQESAPVEKGDNQ
ncbi:MAG: preprotein translocase subunit SecG [Pseudomonadota bacterium]